MQITLNFTKNSLEPNNSSVKLINNLKSVDPGGWFVFGQQNLSPSWNFITF